MTHVSLGKGRSKPQLGPKPIGGLIAAGLGILGALIFIFVGIVVLSIREAETQISIYPPSPSELTRKIEPDIWVEYSEQPTTTSAKPWYYLASQTLAVTEGQGTWYVFASRPFWYSPLPGGQRQGEYFTARWGKNFLFAWILVITSIIDLLTCTRFLLARSR